MKRIIALMLALVIGAALFAGCGKSAEADPAAAGYAEKPTGTVEGATLKTLDEKLLDYISERQSGNFVFSPLSFKYAYALMLAGAEGKTRAELLSALGLNDESELDAALEAVYEFAEKFDGSSGFNGGDMSSEEAEKAVLSMKIANSVWTREGSGGVKDGYKDKIEKYKAEYFDFDSRSVVKKANDWVMEKTSGMIPRILPDGTDGDAITMMLINALYFKGVWVKAFKEEKTVKGDFTTAAGSKVKKDYMQTVDMIYYYSDDDTQLVIVPLQHNAGVTFVIGSTERINEKISKAEKHNVNLAVPKFELETSLEHNELCDFLKACGVSDAFGSAADFSGMNDGGVYVESIIQRAKLGINETGVEGAAATDVIYLGSMMEEPVEFKADRPFSFFVVADTNADVHYRDYEVLFEGRIVE